MPVSGFGEPLTVAARPQNGFPAAPPAQSAPVAGGFGTRTRTGDADSWLSGRCAQSASRGGEYSTVGAACQAVLWRGPLVGPAAGAGAIHRGSGLVNGRRRGSGERVVAPVGEARTRASRSDATEAGAQDSLSPRERVGVRAAVVMGISALTRPPGDLSRRERWRRAPGDATSATGSSAGGPAKAPRRRSRPAGVEMALQPWPGVAGHPATVHPQRPGRKGHFRPGL